MSALGGVASVGGALERAQVFLVMAGSKVVHHAAKKKERKQKMLNEKKMQPKWKMIFGK